jgi:hypothetical protein
MSDAVQQLKRFAETVRSGDVAKTWEGLRALQQVEKQGHQQFRRECMSRSALRSGAIDPVWAVGYSGGRGSFDEKPTG